MKALSIAEPLVQEVARAPFRGAVRLATRRVLVAEDGSGRLLACVSREVGKGPFSLVVEKLPQHVPRQAVVELSPAGAKLADTMIDLTAMRAWSPRLLPVAGVSARLRSWPASAPAARWWRGATDGAVDQLTAESLRAGAGEIGRFWAGDAPLGRGVARLAGLGPGLTPAGDDYLLGVCAALWFLGRGHHAREVAQWAAPLTTRFSAAFLLAAGRGAFSEPWHGLRQALVERSPRLWHRALRRLATQGATSGTAALAGLLSCRHPTCRVSPPPPGDAVGCGYNSSQ